MRGARAVLEALILALIPAVVLALNVALTDDTVFDWTFAISAGVALFAVRLAMALWHSRRSGSTV